MNRLVTLALAGLLAIGLTAHEAAAEKVGTKLFGACFEGDEAGRLLPGEGSECRFPGRSIG